MRSSRVTRSPQAKTWPRSGQDNALQKVQAVLLWVIEEVVGRFAQYQERGRTAQDMWGIAIMVG